MYWFLCRMRQITKWKYGGNGLVHHMAYPTKEFDGQNYVELYIPARTAIVLREIK